jgi:hypothetical protein
MRDPIGKKIPKAKRAAGMAPVLEQAQGPEFKPHYHQ